MSDKKQSRAVSIDGELWRKCLDKAKENGMSLSFVIRRLLQMWYDGLELELESK